MQSRAIQEMIQASAQFCAIAPSRCDGGTGLLRPPGFLRLANEHKCLTREGRGVGRRAARPAKITFFSDTCLKTCGRWARLGHVKLSLEFRKPGKRKQSVLAGRRPRKPRFARAPHPPVDHDELVQS